MRFKIEIIEGWGGDVERISQEVETVPPSNIKEGNLKLKRKKKISCFTIRLVEVPEDKQKPHLTFMLRLPS